MKRDELEDYFALMESFDSGRITAEVFEKGYLALFKEEQRILPQEIFEVLNDLFCDVDAFVGDATIRSDRDLNEEQLRARLKAAYLKLIALTKG